MPKKKIRLPAITVEIPRMGMVVYVSPRTGMQEQKHTAMFTAEIIVSGKVELQSFHLKCKNEVEAQTKRDDMMAAIKKHGQYPFIQTGV